MKILSLDSEFNKNKEILSLGLYIENHLESEFYFSNNVDKYTYKIHGLKNDFLKKYGRKYSYNNFKYIEKFDYIVGFDIMQDLEVMKVPKIGSLYSKKKVIDLKIIINSQDLEISLESLLNIVDIKNTLIHTAFFDAKLTLLALKEIYKRSKCRDSGLQDSFENFLSKSADLTYSKSYGQAWEYDECKYNFYKINLKKEDLSEKINIDFNLLKYYQQGGYVYVLNENLCVYRFPLEYLSKKINFSIKHDLIEFPKIGIKFKDDLTGGL